MAEGAGAPREPPRPVVRGDGEGEGVERGSGGVEEDEVPGAGPREERVGVGPGGVQVGDRGDGVAVLEDESGAGEER